MNIFEKAAKEKYRFDSCRGTLSVENLYDMRLQSRDGFDLDTIAKQLNAQLREAEQESFVSDPSPISDELKHKFEIVIHIINVKKQENEKQKFIAAQRSEIEKLGGILSAKQDEELRSQSAAEIEARLAELKRKLEE
jgi:hypothetical protein